MRRRQRPALDRGSVYVTNAVKHFKFAPRGKRRIHQKPDAGEVTACRWWLDLERDLVRPRLIVAMGATALASLTGSGAGILKRRGSVERLDDGTPVFVTVHPSYILRLPDEGRARRGAQAVPGRSSGGPTAAGASGLIDSARRSALRD